MNGKGRLGLRLAHSLMALNVSLKFSLFGTKYNISSVTRQPGKRKQQNTKPLKFKGRFTLTGNVSVHNLNAPVWECNGKYHWDCGCIEYPDFSGWSLPGGPGCLGWKARPVWQTAGQSKATENPDRRQHQHHVPKYWCSIIWRLFSFKSKQEVCSCFLF